MFHLLNHINAIWVDITIAGKRYQSARRVNRIHGTPLSMLLDVPGPQNFIFHKSPRFAFRHDFGKVEVVILLGVYDEWLFFLLKGKRSIQWLIMIALCCVITCFWSG